MKSLSSILRNRRKERGFLIREVSAYTGIDTALISKFEKGKRLPAEKHLTFLSQYLDLDYKLLKKLWLAEKVVHLVQYEPIAAEVLQLAESRVEYLRSYKTFQVPQLNKHLFSELKKIDHLKSKWIAKKPLTNTQVMKMKEYFQTEYTYESNRIEGNTLSLQETHMIINEGLTIAGKSMTEHLEAINHAEAIVFLEELASSHALVTPRNLAELHSLILKGIDRQNAGRYRSVPVRISGSKHEPPQPYMLEKLMEDYFKHYQNQKKRLHPVILAAEMHERLVSIHPFIDGNGRTSRLIMNLILLSNGYTIANLKGDPDSRIRYYRALEKVQTDNAPEEFYALVIETVKESLQQHLSMI